MDLLYNGDSERYRRIIVISADLEGLLLVLELFLSRISLVVFINHLNIIKIFEFENKFIYIWLY